MVWSNWQGAIWRGAAMMLVFWSGLAWTQTPAQRCADVPAEPTMVVHEDGKSTRCRVLETWKLPDGRTAHLLEALGTGEKITIVSEACAPTNPKAMPIRIFAWGRSRRVPPEGSPLPPHLRIDSDVLITNREPLPAGAIVAQSPNPMIINRTDDTALGGAFAAPGPQTVERGPAPPANPGHLARVSPNQPDAFEMPDEPQIIQFPKMSQGQTPAPANPLIQAQASGPSAQNNVVPADRRGADDQGVVNATGTVPTPGIHPIVQTQGSAGTPSIPMVPAQGFGAAPDNPIVQAQGNAVAPGNAIVPTQGVTGPLVVNGQGSGNNVSPTVGTDSGAVLPPVPGIAPAIAPPPAVGISPGPVLPPVPGIVPAPAPGSAPGAVLPPVPGIAPAIAPPPAVGIAPGAVLPPVPGIAPPAAAVIPAGSLPPIPGLPTSPPPLSTQPPTNTTPPVGAGNAAPAAPPIKSAPDALPAIPSPVADPAAPAEAKKSWRPGAKIASWWQNKSVKPEPVPEVPPAPIVIAKAQDKNATLAIPDEKMKKADDFLAQENIRADKKVADKAEKIYKGAFSTAMNPTPPELKKPDPTPPAISGATPPNDDKVAATLPPAPTPKEEIKPANGSDQDKRDMFGTGVNPTMPPGRSALDVPNLVKLPPPPTPRVNDPMMAPDRLPVKPAVLPPTAREIKPAPAPVPMPAPDMYAKNPWPPGAQSVLAARSGLDGPVAFVPVPTVTVPQPNHPPTPPPPVMPEAPQPFVNAFSEPRAPKGAPQPQQGMMPGQAMMPYGNPMMPYGNPMMQPMPQYAYGYSQMPAYAMNPYAYGYGYAPQAPMMPYRPPMMVSQGPMTNFSRQYGGPLPPQNPFAAPPTPAGYNYPPMMQQPMMPPQPMIQPASYQSTMQTPAAQAQQIEQLIKVMRENAYPAQREWAASMLANYEWRMHPQIVPALLQSAGQDPAATVRAGCVSCLGRMQAAVEPVFGTLHAMRSDIDPRVRSAVEQAFVALGQTPMPPQY